LNRRPTDDLGTPKYLHIPDASSAAGDAVGLTDQAARLRDELVFRRPLASFLHQPALLLYLCSFWEV